jgi:hypothetical protein
MRAIMIGIAMVILLFFSCSVVHDAHCLPRELLEIAQKNGCIAVEDFFDRPGMVKPPYVYGYLPGPEENSAAFWCEKKGDGKRIFLLMFMVKGSASRQIGCADKIEWQRSFPGGLSIYKNDETVLDDFKYLKDSRKSPRKGVRLKGNAIQSEYDGVEVLFYCYEGEWIIRIRE